MKEFPRRMNLKSKEDGKPYLKSRSLSSCYSQPIIPVQPLTKHHPSAQFMGYQLVGDVISIMLWHAEEPWKSRVYRTISADSYWMSFDLAKKIDEIYINDKVILSIGYNECKRNDFLVENFKKNLKVIVEKLLSKGCKEMILTNVPPCARSKHRKDFWIDLADVNKEIKLICEKNENIIYHCNIFQKFCKPKDFSRRKEVIINGSPNFDVYIELFNEKCSIYPYKLDYVTFSRKGKDVLRDHLKKAIRYRILENSKIISGFNERVGIVKTNKRNEKNNNTSIIDEESRKRDAEKSKIKENIERQSSIECSRKHEERKMATEKVDNCVSVDVVVKDELHDFPTPSDCFNWNPTDLKNYSNEKLKGIPLNIHNFFCECEQCMMKHHEFLTELNKIAEEMKEEDQRSRLEEEYERIVATL